MTAFARDGWRAHGRGVQRAFVGLLVALAVLLSGCGGDEPKAIVWDLSDSHTSRDVDWPRPDLDAVLIEPIESVRIRLPGGEVFEAGDEVQDIGMSRGVGGDVGRQVRIMNIDSHPRDTDEAHALGVRWARQLGVPTGPLDEWYEQRRADRERGEEDAASTALAVDSSLNLGGPNGPQPAVRILYSFEDDRPSIVSLELGWPAAA